MELKIRRIPGREALKETVSALTILSFPCFSGEEWLAGGFSTRVGGVSEGMYSTVNFSYDRGDDPHHVRENFRRLGQTLSMDDTRFVVSHQTHTTNVRVVTKEDAGYGVDRERPYHDVDGHVTNVPGMTLITFHADCLPLYFADRKHHAVGLAHAGWKGTQGNIGKEVLRVMKEQYGTKAEDVIAAVGPGICGSCYEIGLSVAGAFREVLSEEALSRCLTDPHEKEDGMHWQLDLAEANRSLLIAAGIPEKNIHLSDICTRCNSDLLFSHRVQGLNRGLNAAFLGIRE